MQQETGEFGLSSNVLSSTPSISKSNENKVQWGLRLAGKHGTVATVFLTAPSIQHEEVVMQSEKVFVHELTSREARETFNDSISWCIVV